MDATLRIHTIVLILSLTTPKIITAVKFDCNYMTITFVLRMEFYICDVQTHGIFDQIPTVIDGLNGTHLPNKSDSDVRAFCVHHSPQLRYFPKNIENVIEPVNAIMIVCCNLQEITLNDLRVFPELKYLSLAGNRIEALEGSLFRHTHNLEVFDVVENPIKRIDPLVFSDVRNLRHLELGSCHNGVVLKKAFNVDQVRKLVKKIESGVCSGE